MPSFTQFENVDKRAIFFLDSISEIKGRIISGSKQDLSSYDTRGITIVIPLSQAILDEITGIMNEIEEQILNNKYFTIHWRRKKRKAPNSLHITVYGIVKPNIYNPDISWKWIQSIQAELQHLASQIYINSKRQIEDLFIEGLGIVGRGAINIRVSDNQFLDALREELKRRLGFSSQGRGEQFNKIVIGRIGPIVKGYKDFASILMSEKSDKDDIRPIVTNSCDVLQKNPDYDALHKEINLIREVLSEKAKRSIGKISLEKVGIQVVHFKDEFLENRVDEFQLKI